MSKPSSLRCLCSHPVNKHLDDDTIACEVCGGWIAVRLTTMEAWKKFQERFRPKE